MAEREREERGVFGRMEKDEGKVDSEERGIGAWIRETVRGMERMPLWSREGTVEVEGPMIAVALWSGRGMWMGRE